MLVRLSFLGLLVAFASTLPKLIVEGEAFSVVGEPTAVAVAVGVAVGVAPVDARHFLYLGLALLLALLASACVWWTLHKPGAYGPHVKIRAPLRHIWTPTCAGC